ncbi:hypothetical protein JTE90_029624 [Oedothorax gibbosus]|uniref:Elongation of very long chain fatty acids protein n=1 Tax=Oedothorax gibbosus TaxID=931172 RepID=A0AAV6VEM3_9ARAC|nr:hypothetical protein JTE90_029624 [Oedothorax gibbosus]
MHVYESFPSVEKSDGQGKPENVMPTETNDKQSMTKSIPSSPKCHQQSMTETENSKVFHFNPGKSCEREKSDINPNTYLELFAQDMHFIPHPYKTALKHFKRVHLFSFKNMASISSLVHHFLFSHDFNNKVLVSNGYICFGVIIAYVVFTKFLGPKIMENRKPFQLKWPMIFHNFLLSAVNFYLGLWSAKCVVKYWQSRCLFRDTEDFKNFMEEDGMYIWQLYLVKFAELIDTVFFVLRKKYNQISFLHVFHHSAVCAVFWWILKSRSVGYYLFIIVVINCNIHVIMYLYYGLSAFGPQMQKYLWWKKHLTSMQITQFCIIQLYMMVGFLTGCEYFEALELSLFSTVTAILVLFLNFYRKTFKEK